jgi:hypothetical protein
MRLHLAAPQGYTSALHSISNCLIVRCPPQSPTPIQLHLFAFRAFNNKEAPKSQDMSWARQLVQHGGVDGMRGRKYCKARQSPEQKGT